jgi:hypothetical protein
MANSIYTTITAETVTGARERVLNDLNALTDGKAELAIKLVSEFCELNSILEKIDAIKETDKELGLSTC